MGPRGRTVRQRAVHPARALARHPVGTGFRQAQRSSLVGRRAGPFPGLVAQVRLHALHRVRGQETGPRRVAGVVQALRDRPPRPRPAAARPRPTPRGRRCRAAGPRPRCGCRTGAHRRRSRGRRPWLRARSSRSPRRRWAVQVEGSSRRMLGRYCAIVSHIWSRACRHSSGSTTPGSTRYPSRLNFAIWSVVSRGACATAGDAVVMENLPR